jgi:hygromycin-B 7''-O-kinase
MRPVGDHCLHMQPLDRPVLKGRSSYARKFQDPAFWQASIDEVLRRHKLPPAEATLGSGGTFPTFLVGEHVVKFFGQRFDGAECFLVERSLHTEVLPKLRVPTPRHVADGYLFDTGWRWPYIVTTRLTGTAWREASGCPGEWQHTLAAELGSALREVHAAAFPDELVWRRDVVGALRATCAARHRRRRILPEFLIDQIDDYLAPPSDERYLVHADLHGDHIFIRDGHLAGIIDWGDAFCGDPYYDLPALFFGTFGGSKPLLRPFLDAYGWPVETDFAHRAMTMTLVHEFNPLGDALPPLANVTTLDELADILWRP